MPLRARTGEYYKDRLAADRLRACYDVAPPETRAYLEGEIDFVLQKTRSWMHLLELGCGYGRVLGRLLPAVSSATGIDTSLASLRLGRDSLDQEGSPRLLAMDAVHMGFRDRTFDMTLCIQNGICSFGVDPALLISEALRVTRRGGSVLFSSYAARFWPQRLEWFEIQAERGLIGPIDRVATGDGVIACTDGFRATTMGPDRFSELSSRLGVQHRIVEVGGSSLFCELSAPS